MLIEPFVVLLALLPLVGYLLVLGLIRVSGNVLVTTGGRDVVALGFAVGGLVAAGPAELFFPNAAAGLFGPWVWLALFTFYSLIVLLLSMTARPRLVIYGRSPDQLCHALLDAAKQFDSNAELDETARQVFLPKLGVRLRLAGQAGMDFTAIESFEPVVSPVFWNQLLGHVRNAVRKTPAANPRGGAIMVIVALMLLSLTVYVGFTQTQQVVEGFRQWLWR